MNPIHSRIQCNFCHTYTSAESNFCPQCGAKIEKEKSLLPLLNDNYHNPHGAWQVTTEGDVEGRSTRNLGTFEGYLDDIAKGLADQSYYSLTFKRLGDTITIPEPKDVKSVNIALDIDSKTWNMTRDIRAIVLGEVLKDRPVKVSEGNYYASVVLNFKDEECGECP